MPFDWENLAKVWSMNFRTEAASAENDPKETSAFSSIAASQLSHCCHSMMMRHHCQLEGGNADKVVIGPMPAFSVAIVAKAESGRDVPDQPANSPQEPLPEIPAC